MLHSSPLPNLTVGLGDRDSIPGMGTALAAHSHQVPQPSARTQRPSTSNGGDQHPPCLGTSGYGQQSPCQPYTSHLSPLSTAGLQLPKSRMHVAEG